MPNQINSTNTPKKYDVSDMHDLASLSESDMNWMCTAISHIRKEVMKLNKLAESGKEVSQYHFSELVTHLDMYEYIAAHRLSHYSEKAEVYDAKMEENKKAESL